MTSIALNAEILSSIASFAYWGANRPGVPLHLRTVRALALTCRAFLEPALDQLWRRQLTLFNLAKTLPHDAWEVYDAEEAGPDGKKQQLIKTTRVIIPKDWARFNHYAAKIRELGYDPRAPFATVELATRRADGVPVAFITSMCIVRGPYELVPNVKRVQWTTYEARLGIRPHVYMFLKAPLTSLALEFPDPGPDDANAFYGDATFVKFTLRAVAEQCPAFRDVELVWPQFEGYAGALSDFLRAVPRLRSFVANVQEWKEEDLAQLATLPVLRRTRVYLEGTQFPWLARPDGLQPFPSLVDLTLDIPSLDRCTAFLVALGPRPLEKLTVICAERPSTPMVNELCLTISTYCAPLRLRNLSLSGGSGSTSSLTRADCLITTEALLPLMSFSALCAFRLDFSAMYALDDAFPVTILSAWPALEALSIGATHGWGRRSLLTFTGLAQVVQLCPKLEQLCLAIDATRGELAPDAGPNEGIAVIDLADTYVPQDEAGTVALSRNLATLFPVLEHISAKTLPPQEAGGADVGTETDIKDVILTEEATQGLATQEFWREVEKQVATFAMLRDMDIPMDLS